MHLISLWKLNSTCSHRNIKPFLSKSKMQTFTRCCKTEQSSFVTFTSFGFAQVLKTIIKMDMFKLTEQLQTYYINTECK